MKESGPALSIGRGWENLGPMPVGVQKKTFKAEGVYRSIWFMGGIYSKVH